MIDITKGNPTSEEIAALVAVLILASGTTVRLASSTAEGWRRSAPFAEVNPCGPSRRDRRWRAWYAGWSSVGPMHVEVVQVGAQRELHAQSVRVLGEGPGGSGGVGAHEDLPVALGVGRDHVRGQLGQRVIEHRDVVGGGVGAGVAGAQQPDQRLPGTGPAVIGVR